MSRPPARRRAGVVALLVTLAMAAIAVLLADRTGVRSSRVPLGVGDVVALDTRGRERLRLVAVATGQDGRYTAIFEPDGADGRSGQLRLTDGAPLVAGGRTLRLLTVDLDSTRGSAVQFQWISDDPGAPRPLFSVGEESVRIPVDEIEIDLAIDGPIPAPGHGADISLAISERGTYSRRRVTRGEPWRLGAGTLTWIGTRERLIAWIDIR